MLLLVQFTLTISPSTSACFSDSAFCGLILRFVYIRLMLGYMQNNHKLSSTWGKAGVSECLVLVVCCMCCVCVEQNVDGAIKHSQIQDLSQ